ncbi:AAA family ATPase [Pseudomonas sp. CCC3.2]|uniref:AAA family ATPase n=1 Tax=unclassified Pseudomonas TaxID=196821 RepID=UPI002AB43A7A|nr:MULTISPECIES: AAA family ATPase [unclassified Pseudomonas]MDY7558980.1 AAA family ATPase [Pseudomonas sp. AB6]MEB0180168.1 AAA family ATPase [Pseudomonas sp. CCC3.2]MEB0209048.1 AAA family ATPase [Pseudomonas sp. AB6]
MKPANELMTTPIIPDAKAVWKVNAVKASSIKPVAIRWLWPGWLAQGKLHILAGAGGTGKTTLLLGLIATITTAGRWPDGERCREAGNALIWSSEDDPSDTLVPRLIAAGADMSRVYIIQGRINAQGEVDPFDPANDIGLLKTTTQEIGGVALLMLDPVVSAVKGDMHKANDVRRGLQGVVDFAEQNMCAVIGISHFAKGGAGSSPADRVIGSQAFSALARTVLVAAKQEDSDMRVLARAKSNIGTDEGGVSYTIEPVTIDGGIETTCVMWGDAITGSAREILGDVEATGDEGHSDNDDPSEALRRILSSGALTGKEVKQLMTENGYSQKQTRSAREKLSVVTVREGFGKEIKTLWSLPQAEGPFVPFLPFVPSDSHSCPVNNVGTNDEKGHEWINGAVIAGAEEAEVGEDEVAI